MVGAKFYNKATVILRKAEVRGGAGALGAASEQGGSECRSDAQCIPSPGGMLPAHTGSCTNCYTPALLTLTPTLCAGGAQVWEKWPADMHVPAAPPPALAHLPHFARLHHHLHQLTAPLRLADLPPLAMDKQVCALSLSFVPCTAISGERIECAHRPLRLAEICWDVLLGPEAARTHTYEMACSAEAGATAHTCCGVLWCTCTCFARGSGARRAHVHQGASDRDGEGQRRARDVRARTQTTAALPCRMHCVPGRRRRRRRRRLCRLGSCPAGSPAPLTSLLAQERCELNTTRCVCWQCACLCSLRDEESDFKSFLRRVMLYLLDPNAKAKMVLYTW